MCEFCNFGDNRGNDIPANKAIVDDEVISFGVLGNGKQSLCLWNDNGVVDISAWAAIDGVDTDCVMITAKINYCPMCGRQLDGQRYRVVANWIHPHKDSMGEYLDDLTYEQAEGVRKAWQKDNIHKNVELSKSDLPFQG